jgi:hypothetical protein
VWVVAVIAELISYFSEHPITLFRKRTFFKHIAV